MEMAPSNGQETIWNFTKTQAESVLPTHQMETTTGQLAIVLFTIQLKISVLDQLEAAVGN